MARIVATLALAFALFAAACERREVSPGAVFVLLDISDTFYASKAASLDTSEEIVRGMGPGDRFAFQRIGECAFGRENVLLDQDLPLREDLAATAKLALIEDVGRLTYRLRSADYTDIYGAFWEVRRQREGAAHDPVVIVLFSDLIADVRGSECAEGRDALPGLDGAIVILADVGEADEDRADPQAFFDRVDEWTARLNGAGAGEVSYVAGSSARVRAAVEEALAQ
ncbi:MAG: hypothetical protein PVI23_11420 [Maricaulaceae bacterium]|jgi:hypothetical protein